MTIFNNTDIIYVYQVELFLSQTIEFRLASDVPAHAEHVVVGTSDRKELCFESPVMQVCVL